MKKIFGIFTAVMLSASFTAGAAGFPDLPDGDVGTAIENAAQHGVLSGYEDGTIGAQRSITRAEMAVMISRCFGAEKHAGLDGFSDVSAEDWYYDAMSRAVAMGAFSGDGDRLNPKDSITFAEVFTIMARVFSMEGGDENVLGRFSDAETIPDWARPYTAMIVENGYWGSGDALRPGEYITRGEFALLLNNIVSVYIDDSGSFNNESGKNIIVRADDVTIESPNGCKLIITADCVSGLTTIKNCTDLKYLVARGGRLHPLGTVFSIRLAMPGTVLYSGDVKIDHGWGERDTFVDFGNAGL